MRFVIPDHRSTEPNAHDDLHRRGRLKQSWSLGVEQRSTKREIAFDDGLTWGSIGQLLGYLLGDVDEIFRDELYDIMVKRFQQSEQEKGAENEASS